MVPSQMLILPTHETHNQTVSVIGLENGGRFKISLYLFGSILQSSVSTDINLKTRTSIGSQYIGFGGNNLGTTIQPTAAPEYLWKNDTGVGISVDKVWRSVAMIGDINRDGVGDIAIGDAYRSQVYVLFGSRNTGYMNMSSGIMVYGNQDYTGFSVSSAGDFNGDGIADMIIGMPYYGKNRNGGSVILYGKRTIANIQINTNLTSVDGMLVIGSASTTTHGIAVTNIGDFNKDGYDDIAVSASLRSAGIIYVIYGSSSPPSLLSIDALQYSQGFTITSLVGSYAGVALSEAGDVNGDGYDDLLIGSVPYANGFSTQKSYVVYGRSSQQSNLNLAALGSNGVVFSGGGIAVNGVGDMNRDGFPDMMITNYVTSFTAFNAFIFVYPEQRTAQPIFAPTSTPSSYPSSKPSHPTLMPTEIPSSPTFVTTLYLTSHSQIPTAIISLQSSTAFNSSSPSEVPVVIPSRLPTKLFPSSSSPLITTFNPSYSSKPSNEGDTQEPTYTPTFQPTFPPSKRTSSPSIQTSCNQQNGESCTPQSSLPSISPFSSLSPSAATLPPSSTITISTGGIFFGTSQRENFVVGTLDNVTIIGNGGGDIFTISPSQNNIVNITQFNASIDIINLQSFPFIYSVTDLNITIIY
jgi:hypothetical protein